MKVLTANRLADGVVVYLGADAGWTRDFADALRLEPEAAEAALQAAQDQSRIVVGPYLVDVSEGEVERRERLRETLRAGGPSVGHSLSYRLAPLAGEAALDAPASRGDGGSGLEALHQHRPAGAGQQTLPPSTFEPSALRPLPPHAGEAWRP